MARATRASGDDSHRPYRQAADAVRTRLDWKYKLYDGSGTCNLNLTTARLSRCYMPALGPTARVRAMSGRTGWFTTGIRMLDI